jgi:hypothetical protein
MHGLAAPIPEANFSTQAQAEESVHTNRLDLRDVILRFHDLPVAVRRAEFSLICRRELTDELLGLLLRQPRPPHLQGGDWTFRLEARQRSLQPFLGRWLTCIFIRLPGVHYTIEVDPMSRSIVHWEWQLS